MKQKTKFEKWEGKISQNGKNYARFKCVNNGWMSAFDKEVIEPLKESMGKEVEVEVAIDEARGWKNIRKFYGVVEAVEAVAAEPAERFEKDPVGLAVELIAAGKKVEEAVEIVKKLRKKFLKV